jgi:hypothetical protein
MSDDADGVWLTKKQIAEIRNISVASAYRLIKRHGWRRQAGNDTRATIRVYVPRSWLDGQRVSQGAAADDVPDNIPSDKAPGDHLTVAAMLEAVSAWRGRAERAEARIDAAELRAQQAETEVERLRAQAQPAKGIAAWIRARIRQG